MRILIAGIGNSWLRDDGFGPKVAEALEKRELPEGPRCSTSAAAAWTWPTR